MHLFNSSSAQEMLPRGSWRQQRVWPRRDIPARTQPGTAPGVLPPQLIANRALPFIQAPRQTQRLQEWKSTRLDAWAPENPAHSTRAELDERKQKCHRYGLAFNKLSGYF